MISLTESAAEKINKAVSEQDIEGKHLRIGVFPGGCGGGYQYALGFDSQGEGDSTFESQGLKLIVNCDDVNKIKGAEIDYVVSEMGEGFRVNNPNPAPEGKKGECGCGDGGCC
jgi:iron-sulfur cluster assembly accessory protein